VTPGCLHCTRERLTVRLVKRVVWPLSVESCLNESPSFHISNLKTKTGLGSFLTQMCRRQGHEDSQLQTVSLLVIGFLECFSSLVLLEYSSSAEKLVWPGCRGRREAGGSSWEKNVRASTIGSMQQFSSDWD